MRNQTARESSQGLDQGECMIRIRPAHISLPDANARSRVGVANRRHKVRDVSSLIPYHLWPLPRAKEQRGAVLILDPRRVGGCAGDIPVSAVLREGVPPQGLAAVGEPLRRVVRTAARRRVRCRRAAKPVREDVEVAFRMR